MKKLTAFLVLLSSTAWGTMAYVQSKSCHTNSGTSATCQYNSNVGTTHLLVVDCIGSRLTACFTVTDDQGDTFTLVGGTTTTSLPSGGTAVWGIWYGTATAGFTTTVTCNDACANTTWVEMSIHEYSGNAYLTSPFDTSSSSSAISLISTTSIVATPITTSRNAELIHAIAPQMVSAPTSANGNIRTSELQDSQWATQDFVLDPAGVYQSSFTFASGSSVNKINQAAFVPPLTTSAGSHVFQ